jgi:hypothetical protein
VVTLPSSYADTGAVSRHQDDALSSVSDSEAVSVTTTVIPHHTF